MERSQPVLRCETAIPGEFLMALIILEEPRPARAGPAHRVALLALGFRPFYLLAALLAALYVPLWLLAYSGAAVLTPALPALLWHAHEMVFGFACAVIVGFLLTAGQSWTGLATPKGWSLAGMAGLWLAGRVALLVLPAAPAAVIDVAFLPVCAIALGRVLWRAGSRRNYFILVILAVLSLANLGFHAGANAWLGISPLVCAHVAVALISTLATVIAGRIIPGFTANALKTVPRRSEAVDRLAIGATAAALLLWALGVTGILTGCIAGFAALLQIWRSLGWRPGPTWRVPLLWILHLSHAWLPVALVGIAVHAFGGLADVFVLHLLTVGVISGLILAMITRTALGHTGRPLRAGPFEIMAYVLLEIAVLLRVLPALLAPQWYLAGLVLAGVAWSAAFIVYLLRYVPILLLPRVDGRPG